MKELRTRVLLLITVGLICLSVGYFIGRAQRTGTVTNGEGLLEVVAAGKEIAADIPVTPPPAPVPDSVGVININTCTREELELLPGIGPAIAQRIIDYRKEHGRFVLIEQLMDINGIGESLFEKIKPYIKTH